MRVSRAEASRELVQRIMPYENAGGHIEDTIIGVEFLDCHTTAGGVPFAEDFLQVSVKQFVDPI